MRYTATIGGTEHVVELEELAAHKLRLDIGGQKFEADLRRTGGGSYSVLIGGRAFDFEVGRDADQTVVSWRDGSVRLNVVDHARRPLAAKALRTVSGRVELKALMPGRVVQVLVKPGDEVARDQGVMVVEAMKMENELKSPKAGKVLEIKVAAGQTVEKGDILAVIE